MFPIYEIGYGFSMLASLTSERTGSWNVSIFLFRMMIKMERQRRGKEESASTQSLMEGKRNLLTSTATSKGLRKLCECFWKVLGGRIET